MHKMETYWYNESRIIKAGALSVWEWLSSLTGSVRAMAMILFGFWLLQFLVNRAGKPIKRYPPAMDESVYKQIEKDIAGMLDV